MTNDAEDEITEADLDRAYGVGISSGLKQASKYLLDKAISYFELGDDDIRCTEIDNIARLLRKLAASLHERATQCHPNTHKEDRNARS